MHFPGSTAHTRDNGGECGQLILGIMGGGGVWIAHTRDSSAAATQMPELLILLHR